MANIDSSLKNWSATASSNQPDAADAATVQADLQQLQATVRQDLATKGSDIASATTTDLGAVAGLMHDITGTTTITGFGTVSAGIWKFIKFEGALTLTHNATSLILPGGANITTANGDTAIVISEGSGNWRCIEYVRVSGNFLAAALGIANTWSALQTFSAGITLSGTASNIATGSNFISNGGTDAGLSFDGSNVALLSVALAVGANPASAGTIRIPNNSAINARNAANSGDLNLIYADASNNIIVGGGVAVVASGTVATGALTVTGAISATTTIALTAGQKLYLDGVAASGDTYILQSSNNVMDFYAGGSQSLRLTTSGAEWNGDIRGRAGGTISFLNAAEGSTGGISNIGAGAAINLEIVGSTSVVGTFSASGTTINFVSSGTTLTVGVGADNGTVSAGVFTDRTKHFDGDALAELCQVCGKDGEIDHDSLPAFARATVKRPIMADVEHEIERNVEREVDGEIVVEKTIEKQIVREQVGEEDAVERDLGAMISMLLKATQQQVEIIKQQAAMLTALAARIAVLEAK